MIERVRSGLIKRFFGTRRGRRNLAIRLNRNAAPHQQLAKRMTHLTTRVIHDEPAGPRTAGGFCSGSAGRRTRVYAGTDWAGRCQAMSFTAIRRRKVAPFLGGLNDRGFLLQLLALA